MWKTEIVLVHRFKAYKLYGNRLFEDGIQVRHLNGDKLDFSNDNILISTASQNMMDIPLEKRLYSARCAAAKKRKFTDGEVELIRAMVGFGIKAGRIARLYGVRKSTMSYIVNRKTYN